MPLRSFFTDPAASPAQRQQVMADLLAQRALQPRAPVQQGRITPSMGIGEGLTQIAEALLARRAGKKAGELAEQEKAERARAQAEALRRLSGQEDPNMVGPPEPVNPFARAQEAISAGVDPFVVEQYMQAQNPTAAQFGVVDPSDFTPESMQRFQQTQDYGDLVPVEKNLFGRYNPRDYTPESLAVFNETGNPADLVRIAPSQFRSTSGGGIVALDPLNPTTPQTVVSDQEGAQGAESLARSQATGRAAGEASGAILAKATNAEGVKSLLDLADPLIDVATGSGTGAAADKVAAFFGKSSTGAEAIAQLQVLQAGLILGMPRLEGPQSDKDRALYIEAAGQIGDPSVPNELKKAAVSTIRAIQDKYLERAGMTPKDSKPTETALPEGVTEEDIAFTMQKHGLTREEVLQRIGNAP